MHLEIACDESGFSGGNLVGRGHSPVFAHASIRIDSDTASQLVQQLRQEIGARGEGEYKSAEILRPRRRPIVLWLLGPSSPIHGNAHVHLTDTRFFVLARMVDVLLGGRDSAWHRLPRPRPPHPTDGARPLQVRRAELWTIALAGIPHVVCQSLSDQQQVAPEGASSDVLRGCGQHGSRPSADGCHRGDDSATADATHRRGDESLISCRTPN